MPVNHPFLTDQTPFLNRISSTSSIDSASSVISASPSTSSASPWDTRSSSHSKLSLSRLSSSTSTSGTRIPSQTASSIPPVDLACFRFMSASSAADHLFGSVASRGSSLSVEERALRRELEIWEAANENDKVTEKKRRRFGRSFLIVVNFFGHLGNSTHIV